MRTLFLLGNSFQFRLIIQKLEIMKFCSVLRDGIKMNDLFYASEMLRFDKEMEYRSITGGIFSLGIIIAVLVGFASMIIDTLSLSTINSVELITKDSSPSASTLTLGKGSNFMMAVELWGVNMTAPVRYFDVLMIQLSTASGQKQYNYSLVFLQPCTREHWADFPEISADYDRLSMSNWVCPPIGTTLQLSGDYTSNIYQYVNISVNPCIDFLHPYQPCADKTQMQNLFLARNDAIRFKIYYTNPLINSGEKDYKSYYLQTTNYIIFGATIGGEAYIYSSDYSITTDNSIWPYPSILEDNGLLIQDKFQFHPYTTYKSTYAAYLFVKSPTNYIYQREVQKISTVFSFIGGLVSAISAALFIFKAYNTLAFEITVAMSIFKPPDDSNVDINSLSMNFFTFFKYHIFHLCHRIGKPRDWPTMAYLSECRDQIINQLDVKALVKRIIFLEYCMTNLFEDYQLEGLQIQKPRMPTQIARIREKCESLDTYEEHLFFGESSKNSQPSQQESQSSSGFSQKKKSLDIVKSQNSGLKVRDKSIIEANKITQFVQCNPSIQNSPAPLASESVFRMLSKNRVRPINDSINQEIVIDMENLQKIKAKMNHRVSKQIRVSKALQRRSINLSFLKKNAEEGNPLSKRIWEQLQFFNAPGSKPRLSNFID